MRIVITGGSGLLALNWGVVMRSNAEVILISHNRSVRLNQIQCQQVELDDYDGVKAQFKQLKPDLVVHTAGFTNVDACESNAETARVSNALIAGIVAQVGSELDLSFVHISTDHLYKGDKPLLTEEEQPCPLNEYGRTKLEGERLVLAYHPGALVVRTNFYGWGHHLRKSFSDWVIYSLREGKEISVATDIFFTPLLIDQLVESVHLLVENKAKGVFNVVGDTRLSKYDFACRLADGFDLDKGLIRKVNYDSLDFRAARPKDLSLSNSKLKALLNQDVGGVEAGIIALRSQEQQGRPQELNRAI